MKPSERAPGSGRDSRGSLLLPAGLYVLALAGVAALAPRQASADTILTYNLGSTSDLVGSTGLTGSAFCAVGTQCPSTSAPFLLSPNSPLSGTISIDTTNQTMTFDLTLTQNASFGNGLTLDAGTSFVASSASPVSVSIQSATSGGVTTDTINLASGVTSTAQGTLLLSSGFSQSQGQGILSGFSCSVAVGGSGLCGFLIGTPVSGSDALQISNNGTQYDGVMSISAKMTAVPLPASFWLLASGAGGLLMMRRRALSG
jgi:hypothetical protein